MTLTLAVTAGPHKGKEFPFDQHDTLLVGRSKDAHLQLSYDDPYFSRRHFLIEVNPPRCRITDLKSRNGIYVNGQRMEIADLKDGDEVKAGHTVFKVNIPPPDPDHQVTFASEMVEPSPNLNSTIDRHADGPTIPGYTLGAELGRGGMGVVYRATRTADGLPVALKTILTAEGVGQRRIDKFVREAKLMASLTHANIAGCLDSGTAGQLVYLVMEMVEGTDASHLLKARGPLAVPAAVRITCQMLSGLAHAHAAGIVHRDVKPSNLLIGGATGKRVVKVADFGLARTYDDCKLSGLTFQGEVGGTPAFMAPEQVTHFRDVKPVADQYSAAATLYNLLTGRYPLDLPKDLNKQLVCIITESAVPIRDRRKNIPAKLAEVIHKALESEPVDRFTDVTAFRKALLPFA